MEKFGRLYPEDMYRYNVHVIHHLPEVVRMYGPLMVNSSYHIENTMGLIGKKVKSFNKVYIYEIGVFYLLINSI